MDSIFFYIPFSLTYTSILQSPQAQEARRDILRYINLTIALTFRMVSPVVAKKLSSLHHFVSSGEARMRVDEVVV